MQLSMQSTAAGRVKIDIYTLLGQRVAALANEDAPAGAYEYSWCGRNQGDALVATGVYILHIETPRQKKNFKVIVAK